MSIEGFDDNFVNFVETINEIQDKNIEHLPDSASYLQKLENKLVRLKKNGNKDLKSKDILSILEKVREDQMSRLNESNNPTTFLPEMDYENKETSNSYIERKLFPHKNALTYEELQHLLEADVLAKLSAENIETVEKMIER